ncbi:MAG: response regulator transcription factor [Sulfuritalea sp.]|jgi:DNA-binding response OmpR family regulator|nr:response regulator transcription factor [Sulfuritalea sp.]
MSEADPAPPPDTRADPVLTALVVEDAESIAKLLRFILEREGFRVEHAGDGREAQRLIAVMAPPAVVLLDVMLPYVDGFELIASIRAQPGWEQLPILMLSSKGSERDIARALDAGADDYMVKPFQPDELKARLRRLLRGRP